MPFTEEHVRGLFLLASIPIKNMWETPNQYFKDLDPAVAKTSKWFLVQTEYGIIMIGWRKRVLNIDWSGTPFRDFVTQDNVTSERTYVHAGHYDKALQYLANLWSNLQRQEFQAQEEKKKAKEEAIKQ